MSFLKILAISSLVYLVSALNASHSKTITYEDIIKFSKPTMVQLAHDGTKVAYVLQHGVIENNTTIDTLYSYDIKKQKQTVVAKKPTILQFEWDPQSESIYLLSKEKNNFQVNQYLTRNQKLLASSNRPITVFLIDPTNHCLVYLLTKYDSEEVVQKRLEDGYVYQWKEDSFLTLCGSYRKKICEEVILLDLSSGGEENLTEIDYQKFWNGDTDCFDKLINKIAISPDKRYFAFEVFRKGRVELGEFPISIEILIWDHLTHRWIDPPAANLPGTKVNPCWIDHQKLVFQLGTCNHHVSKLHLFDCDSQNATELDFSVDFPTFNNIILNSQKQLVGLTKTQAAILSLADCTYKTVEFPEQILPKAPLIPPSVDGNVHYVATINESSNVPPEIVLFNFDSKQTKIITHLNPWIEEKQLGHVEELSFVTKNGVKSKGYLVHPVNEKPNTRYPLILGTYGFFGGFILDAEWHTTFPTQVLAAEGYAVLLLNDAPGLSQNLVGDPAKAMQNEGWNALELFETAVDTLVDKGLVDPSKVGIYGWSHGGFIVNFLIAHSAKFKAACYGEGADYNPSGYWWSGEDVWPKILDNIFGGPPWGETLSNYQSFCSFFNVPNIHTPVLMEYADIGCQNYQFEMYTPLRMLHIPAELVLYKDEQHNFVRPKARLASMKRKVDWFNYWLLDKKDPNPKHREQYTRWEAMKQEFQASTK